MPEPSGNWRSSRTRSARVRARKVRASASVSASWTRNPAENANWPAARAYAWKTLLRARAIENLCFVVGVNRVGTDGNGIAYSGDSAVLDFLGQPLSACTDAEAVTTTTLQAAELAAHRERFPAMLDADRFELR